MQNRTIILISGKQRAGKNDTAHLINRATNFRFTPASFAEPIKKEFANRFNLSLEEVEHLKNTKAEVRKALIDISQEAKTKNPYHWVDICLLSLEGDLIISDLRYKFEIEQIYKEVSNVYTVRVECPRDIRASRGTLTNEEDTSETDLDDYDEWDYVVHNDTGRDNLIETCDIIADSLLDILKSKPSHHHEPL